MTDLRPEQLDVLTELVNIGVGRAAAILNEMTQVRVQLSVPVVRLISRRELGQHLAEVCGGVLAGVQLGFKGPLSGKAALIFPPQSAANLVATLTGEEAADNDLDSVRVGTLTEVGNIVLNGVLGTMTNMLKQPVKYSVPNFFEDATERAFAAGDPDGESAVLIAEVGFKLEDLLIQGNIVLLFELGSLEAVASAIDAISAARE